MSINLTRRDAIKGAMAASAALAAAPYLGNLVGGVQPSPIQNAPVSTSGSTAVSAKSGLSALNGAEPTILYIKGDVVKSYSGPQTISVQDAALASRLRSAVHARFE